jgi:O-acetyl-ADP-ribose deacetylase
MTEIEVIQGDITQMSCDAIVNAANSSLLGGGGVDGAIHRAAGPELSQECRKLKGCQTGDAKLTKGYKLPARYVIHAVGPVWQGGQKKEVQLLESCYLRSLQIASEKGLKTIALPCISTGAYRFPKGPAARIAVNTIRRFIKTPSSLTKISLVCFSREDFELYQGLLNS